MQVIKNCLCDLFPVLIRQSAREVWIRNLAQDPLDLEAEMVGVGPGVVGH
jgi:hypothetical protein